MIPSTPSSPAPQPDPTPPSAEPAFRWLRTGGEGLDAMLEAIHGASVSILLEIYIFTAGPLGEAFRAALVQARLRGVRVRILIDAVGSIGLSTSFWAPLVQAGGEFRWFNTFKAAERYGCRDHRKMLVVDGRLAFIGGFNIAEVYHGDGVLKGWRDLGLQLRGPVVAALTESFEDFFAKADSRPLAFPHLRTPPETEIHGDNWALLLSGPGRGRRVLKRNLVRDLAKARRVQIICAYFVPTWRLRRALMRVARRGGEVRLILAGQTDVPVSQMASRSLYSKLMRAGVQIYEYLPQILHAKLFLIDGITYAGSANLDARSLKLNYELLLRISDPGIAAEARAIFEADLSHCRAVELEQWRASRGFWARLLERAAYFAVARVDPYITNLRWRNRIPLVRGRAR